jgi:hypothetical protein
LIDKLKKRWNVKSAKDVLVILVVFALTGFSIMFLRHFLADHFEWARANWFRNIYYWIIFPVYNLVLLMYGFIFGKFTFFWEFEKRFFKRIGNLFVKNKSKQR